MGTLYQGSAPHKSLRLSMGGSCVSDYVKKFATKDKPEEKALKGKHVPGEKGIQAEGKNSLEDDKRQKKLDEPVGGCEKMNSAGTDLSKADSGPCRKERTAQGETTETLGCQQQKDVVIGALDQNDSLCCIGGSGPPGPENTGRASGLEDPPTQTVNPKPTESKQEASEFMSPTQRAVPSASKPGEEVIQTRISVNVQGSDARQGPLKSQDRNVGGGHAGKSVRVPIPQPPPPAGEGAKRCPEPCKGKPVSKSGRIDPSPGGKGAKLSDKQGERTLKLADQKPFAKAEEKGELKGKAVGAVAKDAGKDPGATMKRPKEASTTKKDSKNDGKLETVESGGPSPTDQESGSGQPAGKPSQNVALVEAGKREEVIVDDSPPPPAPFEHRIVSVKQTEVSTAFSICHHEVLGGGRFGEVHKCTEKSTGLCLAAKIIKVKAAKEREEVKNEINIMNQLNHVNLIQLYDAFEGKNNLTLIMEYVDGGELFDRITDENYHLTELDAILFTKQICEGIHYLHQQYILHLDLKPENILCVNRTGNQIKIIDFGLARRYKPREKLKVNFGTPEFLAPEVVNYDFVSFPTDMWSVGVIAYMLLSGLSPFLGETDTETMNYIVNCSWDFDAEAFEQVSEDAKDFVSRLLVKEKCGRTSAANCLKHEWLTDLSGKAQKTKVRLKSQLLLQSYMTHKKWKKHFYVVAAANRLRRFPSQS
ncbi:myosin light chain kinase 3 isoform X2 [Paroedura picta]|uniref:myosin light chain kinase 3 isoform X2 n=1 Tax=Paroedura picta TaxID=143630 RepID=UPI004055CBAE